MACAAGRKMCAVGLANDIRTIASEIVKYLVSSYANGLYVAIIVAVDSRSCCICNVKNIHIQF